MTKHAYYMTQRPFSPGAQPKQGLVESEDFGGGKYVDEVGCKAWSRIVYDRELTEQEVSQYELVPAEQKLFFGYVKYADGSTMCHAKGTLAEVEASEERVREASKVRVRGFKRNEVSREQFEEYR